MVAKDDFMTVFLPIYHMGLTLQEIPSEISFYLEMGNCQEHCPHCHSPWLWQDLPFTPLDAVLPHAKKAKAEGCTAILLMGGSNNGISPQDLRTTIQCLNKILPVGLYSGNDAPWVFNLPLKWVKTGRYEEKLGGLNHKTTNQRFYENIDGKFIDKTFLFQNRE